MSGIRRIRNTIGALNTESEKEVIYCQHCRDITKCQYRLGKRIYLPDVIGKVKIPPDDDKWRQCHNCGKVYARYQVKEETQLSALTVPSESPFATGGGIKALESRRFDRTGKAQYKRKFKQNLEKYKEEDIKQALKKGSKLVSYVKLT